MGNHTSGTSGWLFTAEEKTLVTLRLNDARSITLGHGEDVYGLVSIANAEPGNVAAVTRHEPARFLVGLDSVLVVEFRAGPPSAFPVTPGANPAGGRVLGEVRLPLEHVQRRCGRSLYFLWFPLCAPWQQNGQGPTDSGAVLQHDAIHTLEHFDRALRNAARDPRWPMVCLSLCPADSPEAIREVLDVDISYDDKANRFSALMHSHAQHARLLQALYRICRTQQQHVDGSISDTMVRNRMMNDSWASPDRGGDDADGGYLMDDINRLQNEISSTTAEANTRINQASDAIRTLRDRISNRNTEHDRTRRGAQKYVHDAELLEAENERLQLTLTRNQGAVPHPDDGGVPSAECPEEEIERLRKDVSVLKEQKEALMLILEDLYGATSKGKGAEEAAAASAATGHSEVSSPAPFDATVPIFQQAHHNGGASASSGYPPPEQEWTNLLPRPSELLLESGMYDD